MEVKIFMPEKFTKLSSAEYTFLLLVLRRLEGYIDLLRIELLYLKNDSHF